MNWKKSFQRGSEIILATCSEKNLPNANIVVSLGFVEGKLLVADCQMEMTIENLRANRNVCVVGGYFRLKGKTQIFRSGNYFNACLERGAGPHKPKNAILITIKQVFDLDNVKVIE